MKKRILSALTMVVMMFAFSITAYADVYKQDPPDPDPEIDAAEIYEILTLQGTAIRSV